MHHPRSISAVRNFQFAAFLLVGNRLLALVAGAALIVSWIRQEQLLMILGAALASLSMILVVVQWIAASRCKCPLCMTPVLAPKACMKHRRARVFLGSHRMRVAVAILLQNRFRCQYCNETTTMEAREVLHRSDGKWLLQPDGKRP